MLGQPASTAHPQQHSWGVFDVTREDGQQAAVGVGPAGWAFGKRMFGGFSAASALLGAATFAPSGSAALSVQISFITPATPEPFRVEATDLRIGRSTSTVNARLVQGGQTRVTCSAWFVPVDRLPGGAQLPAPPKRDRTVSASGRHRVTFDAAFERQSVAYPSAIEAWPAHEGPVSLWIRLADDAWSSSSQLVRQASDLLILDSHLAESLVWRVGADPQRSYSLDLAVRWFGGGLDDPWRLLDVASTPAGRFGCSEATLRDAAGHVTAVATQTVAIGPPRKDLSSE